MTPDAPCVCGDMRSEHTPPSGPCINLECECEQFTPETSPVAELMRLGYTYADALAACYEQNIPLGELDPDDEDTQDDREYVPSLTCDECGEEHESTALALACCTLAPHIEHAMDPEPDDEPPVSFVQICPVCKGDSRRATCFNCVPSRNPQHPGRGYVLRGYNQPRDYPEFAEIVDVPYGEHWIVLKHRKNYTEIRRLSDGFVTQDHQGNVRYATPAEYYDPARWVAPPLPTPAAPAPTCTDPSPRETVQKAKLWEPPAETFRTETEINGWRPEQGTLIDVPKSRKPQPVPANQGVLL